MTSKTPSVAGIIGGSLVFIAVAGLFLAKLFLFSDPAPAVQHAAAAGPSALPIRLSEQPLQRFDVRAKILKSLALAPVGYSARIPDGAEEFDTDAADHTVVRVRGGLYDVTTGEIFNAGGIGVRSVAFYRGALAAITTDGQFAYMTADNFKMSGPAPIGAARIRGGDDGSTLFFLRDDAPYALAAMDSQGSMHALSGAPGRIDSVGGTYARHLFSVGTDLYLQKESARPELLLHLPQSSQVIVGIATRKSSTYFSTSRGVYLINGSLAVPVALGLGGPIKSTAEGLLLLDSGNGRLYRLSPKV